ncbi:MAG: hypothetical protein HRU11_11505 [Parvularculaceae bacterium]|nr:hypothetical protein [Parvularculaceae bacterium]
MTSTFFSSTIGLTILSLLSVVNTGFSVFHVVNANYIPAALAGVSAAAWIVLLIYSLLRRN